MAAWVWATGICIYAVLGAAVIAVLRQQVHLQPARRWRSSGLLLTAAATRVITYSGKLVDPYAWESTQGRLACHFIEECALMGAQSLAVYHWSRFLVPPRSPASASLRRRAYLTINALLAAVGVGGAIGAIFFYSQVLELGGRYAFVSVLSLTSFALFSVVVRIRKRLSRFRAAARHVRALRQMWRILVLTIITAFLMLWHAVALILTPRLRGGHLFAGDFVDSLVCKWVPNVGIYVVILIVMSGSGETRGKKLPLQRFVDSSVLEAGDGPSGGGEMPLMERRTYTAPLLADEGNDSDDDPADPYALLPAERVASVITQDEGGDSGSGEYVAPSPLAAPVKRGLLPSDRAPLGAAPAPHAALARGPADGEDSDAGDDASGGHSRTLAAHVALSWTADALSAGIVALRAVCIRAPAAAGKEAEVLGSTDAQPIGRGASCLAIPIPVEPCPSPELAEGEEGAATLAASALTRFRTSCDAVLLVMGVTALEAPVAYKRSVVGVCLGTLSLPRHALLSTLWAAHVPLSPACAGLQGPALQSALRAACRGDLWTKWPTLAGGGGAAALAAAAGPKEGGADDPASSGEGTEGQQAGVGRAALAALGLSTQGPAAGLALALHAAGVVAHSRTAAGPRKRGAKAARGAEDSGDALSPKAAPHDSARDRRKPSRSHASGDPVLWAESWLHASTAVVAALATVHGATVQVRQGSTPAALLEDAAGNGAVSDPSSDEEDQDAGWAKATKRASEGRAGVAGEDEDEDRDQGAASAALEAQDQVQRDADEEKREACVSTAVFNAKSTPRGIPRQRSASLGDGPTSSGWGPLRGPVGEDVWSLGAGETVPGPAPTRLRHALAQLHAVSESPSMQFRVAAVTTGTSARGEVGVRVYSMRCAKHSVPALAPPTPGASGLLGAAAHVSAALAGRRAQWLQRSGSGNLHHARLPMVRARSAHPNAEDVLRCAPHSARLVEMAVLLAREAASGAEAEAAAALRAFDAQAFAAGAAVERLEMEGAAAAAGLHASSLVEWPRVASLPRDLPLLQGVPHCEGLLPALLVGKALCATHWARVQAAAASSAGAGWQERRSAGGGADAASLPHESLLRVCGPAPRVSEAESSPTGAQWWAGNHVFGSGAAASAAEAGPTGGDTTAGGTGAERPWNASLALSALPRMLPSMSTCGGAVVLTPPQAETCLTLAEVLVEGRFCWRVPQLLLQLLAKEHKAELQHMEGERANVERRVRKARNQEVSGKGFIGLEALISDLKGSEIEGSIVTWMEERVAEEEKHIALLTTAAQLCSGGRCRGHSFRLSVTKKDMPLQFVPTNLHVHWASVADSGTELDTRVGVLGTPPCAAASPHQALVLPPSLRASLAPSSGRPVEKQAPRGGARRAVAAAPRTASRPALAATESARGLGSALQLPRWQATSTYPTVTMGGFSAHGRGHKCGGIGGLRRSVEAARDRVDDTMLRGAVLRVLQRPHAEAGTVKHLLTASVFGHPCPVDESTSVVEIEQTRASAEEAVRRSGTQQGPSPPAPASPHRSDLVHALTGLHAVMLEAAQSVAAHRVEGRGSRHFSRKESSLITQQGMAWSALQALHESTRLASEAALRTEMCFSQALGAVAEGAAAVFQHELSQSPLHAARAAHRWAAVGLLLQVECLLSTMGKEASMLSDHYHAVRCLDGVDIELCIVGRRSRGDGGADQQQQQRRRRQRAMHRQGLCDGPTLVEGAASTGRADRSRAAAADVAGDLFPEEARLDPRDAGLRVDGTTGRLILSLVARVPDPTLRAIAAQMPERAVAGKGTAEGVVVPVGVHAVTVAQGVNEVQSVANMRGVTSLQEAVNADALPRIRAYCARFSAFNRGPSGGGASEAAIATIDPAASGTGAGPTSAEVLSDTVRAEVDAGHSASLVNRAVEALERRLARLEAAERGPKKEKNVRLLVEAAGLVRAVGGVRLTCCKSGKDRTGMSVTYEQARLLQERHGLAQGDAQEAMDVTRAHGVRRANCGKNTGSDRFAFNRFQRRMLPPELKPPKGCGGSKVT